MDFEIDDTTYNPFENISIDDISKVSKDILDKKIKANEELLKKYLIDKFTEKYVERKKQEEVKELENKKEEREEEYNDYLRLKAKFEKE
jgi:hypothetical protein